MKITMELDFTCINEEILKEYQDHLAKWGIKIENILEQFLLSEMDVYNDPLNHEEHSKEFLDAMAWFKRRMGLEYNLHAERNYKPFKSTKDPFNETYKRYLINSAKHSLRDVK